MEAQILPAGRSRTRVNRKAVSGRRELGAAAPCTIFSPEDLVIVSGGPKGRREVLDDALAVLDAEGARAADETERVLRQRAALLRQSGGRAGAEVAATLDVWDQRLADAGKVLVAARERLVADLDPLVATAYGHLAGVGDTGPDGAALRAELGRRSAGRAGGLAGPTTCGGASTRSGPTGTTCSSRSRGGRPGPTPRRASSAAWRWPCAWACTSSSAPGRRSIPTLLLDDVFSELDPARSRALVAELPAGQSILTTAAPLPEGIVVARLLPVQSLGAP